MKSMYPRKSCGGHAPGGARGASMLHFKAAPREVGKVGAADPQAAGAGGSAVGAGGRAAGARGVGARDMMIGFVVEPVSEAEASTEFVDVDCSAEELAEESGMVLARNMVQSTHLSIRKPP